MAEHEVVPHLPTSGQIIGALVTRLRIRHPVLQRTSARRYFSGNAENLVRDSTREEIITAIAEALTASGFISTPESREGDSEPAARLAAMLLWHADNWDLSRTFLRRRMAHVTPENLSKVWEAYVRPAVGDLALRIAAQVHLSGSHPAMLRLLEFASHTGRGNYLNQRRQQAGLSLENFAEQVDVDNHTVDDWMYRGARPTNAHLADMARILADGIVGTTEPALERDLRALYWVSDVAALLAEHIGPEAVEEAVGRLRRYAEAAHSLINDHFPLEDRVANLTALADLGSGARVAEPLLLALVQLEGDPEWREDLRATGTKWIRRVISANIQVNLAEVDELIDQTEGQLLRDWDVSNPEAYDHYRRSQELQAQGRLYEALAEVETAARLDPTDPANHFTIGSVKTGLGLGSGDSALVEEGLRALWLAAALDPRWIVPWTEIGAVLLQTGRAQQALAHLRNVKPDCGPLDSRYFSALGAVYWNLDQLSNALASYEAALDVDPEETANLLAASELAMLTGDVGKQRRYLRRARHFGAEEDTENLWELLREYDEAKRADGTAEYDRQIAIMDAVIRLNPKDEYAYLKRGRAYFSKGEDDLALEDLDTVLRLNPDQAGVYWLRCSIFGCRKQWSRLIDDLTELIRLRPDSAMAYYRRGLAYGEQDLLDEAIDDLSHAIRLDSNLADAYRSRGDGYRYRGEYDLAIRDFDTALRLDPENAAAHLGRGATYRMMGDPERAIAEYSCAIRLSPGDALAYRFRGDAQIARGHYERAIADFNRALNINPKDSIAYFQRANAHLFSEDPDQALADFNEALKLDPASGRATYGRGLAREWLGDPEGAAGDYQRARELGFDDQDVD